MGVASVKPFPGYGIVYPDGQTGVRVVKSYTEGPQKVFNPDGSRSYTTPPPTIHELYGGGFSYADGSPVTDRTHLEGIGDVKMRDRALAWFDSQGKLSEEATKDVPKLDMEKEKVRPEPVFVLSSDVSKIDEPDKPNVVPPSTDNKPDDPLAQVYSAISSIADIVRQQGEMLAKLQSPLPPQAPPTVKSRREQTDRKRAANRINSERMKEYWAKKKAEESGKEGEANGNVPAESGEEVQKV